MKPEQLNLFQDPSDHEKNIFEQAKIFKKIIQDLFSKSQILLPESKNEIINEFGLLNFKVIVDLVSDSDPSREPSTPRVFIWKYTPEISLQINGITEFLLEKGKNYDNNIGPKVIKSFMYEYYTEKTFSKIEFQNIAEQYYSLETLMYLISSPKFLEELNEKLGSKPLIIRFENKLFPRKNEIVESFIEKDIINKIKNYYSRIRSLQKENWFLIGSYSDFTDSESLLCDLDRNLSITRMIKESPLSPNEQVNNIFKKLFQNDYLFLNNKEVFSDNYNTDTWYSKCILSPSIMKEKITSIDESKIKAMCSGIERIFYCYLKKDSSGRFNRNEILLPKNEIDSNKVRKILTMALEMLEK